MRVGLPGRVKDRGLRLVNNYTHNFFELSHNEINDMCIKFIDSTDINETTTRKGHVTQLIYSSGIESAGFFLVMICENLFM